MEANIAYYCLHKLNMLPSTFVNLNENEKSFIIAAIKVKIKNEKKKAAKR